MRAARWVDQRKWPSDKRRCLKCRRLKALNNFHKHDGCKHGRNSICKTCRKPVCKQQYRRTRIAYRLFYAAKYRAQRLGIPFHIQLKDVVVPVTCPVLGVPLHYKTKYSPSIDRINPKKGYVRGNVRVISKRANTLKNNGTLWEFQRIVNDLARVA